MVTNPNQANAAYNAQAAYEAQVAHEAAVNQAQVVYEAQVYEAQAAYEAQMYEAQAAYEAQLEAQQSGIIHTTANWFWQCHLVCYYPCSLFSVIDPRLFNLHKELLT